MNRSIVQKSSNAEPVARSTSDLRSISRRRFLQSSAAASSALILPGHVLGLGGENLPARG